MPGVGIKDERIEFEGIVRRKWNWCVAHVENFQVEVSRVTSKGSSSKEAKWRVRFKIILRSFNESTFFLQYKL